MSLAIAIRGWGVTVVYLAITVIISLIGWTDLGREVRGRIMALRHEDFVLAAELCGARPRRVISFTRATLHEPTSSRRHARICRDDRERDRVELSRAGLRPPAFHSV